MAKPSVIIKLLRLCLDHRTGEHEAIAAFLKVRNQLTPDHIHVICQKVEVTLETTSTPTTPPPTQNYWNNQRKQTPKPRTNSFPKKEFVIRISKLTLEKCYDLQYELEDLQDDLNLSYSQEQEGDTITLTIKAFATRPQFQELQTHIAEWVQRQKAQEKKTQENPTKDAWDFSYHKNPEYFQDFVEEILRKQKDNAWSPNYKKHFP
jgi:hypothetical protein